MSNNRIVSMGVAEAERVAAVIDGHGPEPEAILAAVREHGRPYSRSTLRNGPGAVLAEISGDGFWKGRTPDADGIYRVTLAVAIPPDAPGAKSNIIAYGLHLTRTALESEARRA